MPDIRNHASGENEQKPPSSTYAAVMENLLASASKYALRHEDYELATSIMDTLLILKRRNPEWLAWVERMTMINPDLRPVIVPVLGSTREEAPARPVDVSELHHKGHYGVSEIAECGAWCADGPGGLCTLDSGHPGQHGG